MKFIKSLYSIKGIIIIFFLLIFINAAMLNVNIRWDLTQDKLYSLSKGTKEILKNLDEDITLKLFYSKDTRNLPPFLKNYAKRVTDLLREYEKAGKGKIRLQIYNPVADSEEEEMARQYGIKKIDISPEESIYFGLAAIAKNKTDPIPFIDPAKETRLEYEITRCIETLSASKKKKIGILSSLKVFGKSPFSINTSGIPNSSRWLFVEELEKTYDIVEIDPYGDAIYDNLDLLIIIHPKNINERLQYQIDQYILKGKNALIFIDPFSVSDEEPNGIRASLFEKFLSAWKIDIDINKLVADFDFATLVLDNNGFQTENPYFISPTEAAFNQNSVIVSNLETLILPLAGAILPKKECPYDLQPLIVSSDNANLDANFTSHFQLDEIKKTFVPSNRKYNFAVKITGKFDTAFPNGKPIEQESDNKEKNNAEAGLKKGLRDSNVIIVTDADLLYDDYYVRRQNFFGFDISQIFNDNLNFLSNAVEVLTGNDSLISVRTIGRFERPFTKALELEEKAEKKWLAAEQILMRKVEETNAKIEALQPQNQNQEKIILTKEQENEIEKFYQEKIKINKELKEVKKKLRADIENLGRKIKFFNILFVPILIVIAGITFALYRRKYQNKNSKF